MFLHDKCKTGLAASVCLEYLFETDKLVKRFHHYRVGSIFPLCDFQIEAPKKKKIALSFSYLVNPVI